MLVPHWSLAGTETSDRSNIALPASLGNSRASEQSIGGSSAVLPTNSFATAAIVDRSDPLFLQRLRLYVVEGALLCGVSMISFWTMLKKEFSIGYLGYFMVPYAITGMRVSCSLYTLFGCHRSFSLDWVILWRCSMSVSPCISLVLVVWYFFVILVTVTSMYYSGGHEERQVVFLACHCTMLMANAFLFIEGYMSSQNTSQRHANVEDYLKHVRMFGIIEQQLIWRELPTKERDVNAMCIICLDSFTDSHEITKLRCGHVFHKYCATEWFLRDIRCPLRCRIDHLHMQRRPVTFEHAAQVDEAPALVEPRRTPAGPRYQDTIPSARVDQDIDLLSGYLGDNFASSLLTPAATSVDSSEILEAIVEVPSDIESPSMQPDARARATSQSANSFSL